MITPGIPRGMALQIEVTDIDRARHFYSALFDRTPDYAPHEDFLEWRLTPDAEAWWQVVETTAPRPLKARLRFTVPDVDAAASWAHETLGVTTSAITRLPDVVAFTDFDDPWSNRLGYYEDLLPSGQQPTLSTSVHCRAQYEHGCQP